MQETIWVKLADYGVAFVLVGIVMAYTWYLATKVVPQQQAEHMGDLRKIHDLCEERLKEAYTDAKQFYADTAKRDKNLLAALSDRLAQLDRTLELLGKQFSAGGRSTGA